MSSRIYVYNQYYLDLLKKIRNAAKRFQEKSDVAKQITKAIKKHYQVFDKSTSENIEFFRNNIKEDTLAVLCDLGDDECIEWFKTNSDMLIYREITLGSITTILKDYPLLQHYFIILIMFLDDELTDEDTKNIIQRFKGVDDNIPIPERYEKAVKKVVDMNMKKSAGFTMEDVQDTSIGKLAKDIIEDLNIDKIKESVKNDDDILKALSNSENGLGNLLTNVTQKMASKLSNGEIQQDDLIKDAMHFAQRMPQFQNMGAKGGGGMPDLGQMMKMMNGLMGAGGNKMGAVNKKLKKKMNGKK